MSALRRQTNPPRTPFFQKLLALRIRVPHRHIHVGPNRITTQVRRGHEGYGRKTAGAKDDRIN